MKKLLIIIAAVCYCVAPDLFVGPVDDAIVFLASTAYAMAASSEKEKNRDKNRDPEYVKQYREFFD